MVWTHHIPRCRSPGAYGRAPRLRRHCPVAGAGFAVTRTKDMGCLLQTEQKTFMDSLPGLTGQSEDGLQVIRPLGHTPRPVGLVSHLLCPHQAPLCPKGHPYLSEHPAQEVVVTGE